MHSQSIAENTPIGKLRTLFQQEDKSLEIVENDAPEPLSQPSVIRKSIIHFYFCMEGTATFEFGPHYVREIQRQHNYFFFDPGRELPFTLRMSPHSRMVVMTISLESLHQLFVHEPLPFLKPENINQKFYDEREIPSHLMVELNQLYNIHLSTSSNSIYYQGKILELLALYFSQRKADTETCPFLNDQETVRKIKNAKDYILQHMEAPPTLKELARLMGLNEYQLKAGFKEIYGNTVFGFLLDHKLDSARVLLDSMKFQVAEVAYKIGYTNPSHFIAAFKKKFGVTPKKYLMAKAA
ncbi:MAG: AraC family transcriptional regulator [Cyclobacteriaceae bacterium]|jgi:AraC-like DNA-binding protein|nr:AraC family transcriptional regulator [Cytophagales bacterium]HNP76524.1 AraC family transcriptional regulator [Cyclobacteriaceae bacterium]HQQ83242.1 AraC family transcriptional regulator [Cyclobacteriaceae bacterium]